jgi:hypothetical protein
MMVLKSSVASGIVCSLQLIQIETEYHRQALESLESIIPQLQESIGIL